MFQCFNCNSLNYLNYEQRIFICFRCKKQYNFCLDCPKNLKFPNNLDFLKNKFPYLFRNYRPLLESIKNINLPYAIIELINSYIKNKYTYKNSFVNNIDLQFISDIGIQLKEDDELDEFYIRPVFLCNKCLNFYDEYCILQKKFI